MRQLQILFLLLVSLVTAHLTLANIVSKPSQNTAGLITQNTTLNVPSYKPKLCGNRSLYNIQQALICLGNYKIASNAIVTISVNQEPQQIYDTITVNHSDGDKVHIVGNCSDTSDHICTLQFNAGDSGLVVQNVNKLGLFDNFTLLGSQASDSNNISGIYAANNSAITLGHHVTVESFWYGIFAESNSSIDAEYATSSHNLFDGISANNSSSINASYATASNNAHAGIAAVNGSAVSAGHSTADDNGDYGFYANRSLLVASNGNAHNNGLYDAAIMYVAGFSCYDSSIGTHWTGDPVAVTGGCW